LTPHTAIRKWPIGSDPLIEVSDQRGDRRKTRGVRATNARQAVAIWLPAILPPSCKGAHFRALGATHDPSAQVRANVDVRPGVAVVERYINL